jgi:tetratricopeptide (TPR) repeat protein
MARPTNITITESLSDLKKAQHGLSVSKQKRLQILILIRKEHTPLLRTFRVPWTYRALGQYGKAIFCLKKIIAIDSAQIGSYINLGFIYSATDSLDLAARYFEKAISIDPAEPLTYNNLGYVYYKTGNYDKAISLINKSLSIYHSNSYAYRNLALVYIAKNNLYEACTALNYANDYGFQKQYGDEVKELLEKHCKK